MDEVFWLYAAAIALVTVIGLIALGGRRSLFVRAGVVVMVAGFFGVSYLALADLLGRAKPIEWEWSDRNVTHADVRAVRMVEGEAIYIWVNLPEDNEPRAYALPWERRFAEQFEEQYYEAERQGGVLRIEGPLSMESLLSGGDKALSIVQPPRLPQKEKPRQAIQVEPGK